MMSKICLPVPLLLLLLPAVCEGSSIGNMQSPNCWIKFGQHYTKRTWTKAHQYCMLKHTKLVTIGNKNAQCFDDGQGWIGLYQIMSNSGIFSWMWSSGEEVDQLYWEHGQPQNYGDCVYKIKGRLSWRNDDCHSKRHFMCQEETLVLVKENKTWEQALEHCRALEAVNPNKPATAYQNHRYDLASLLTVDDHVEARAMIKHQASTDEVWTGLRFLAGQWEWVGGGRVRYVGLDTCPTVQLCGVLQKGSNGQYATRQCTLEYNFLCYRKP